MTYRRLLTEVGLSQMGTVKALVVRILVSKRIVTWFYVFLVMGLFWFLTLLSIIVSLLQ